MPSKSKKQHNFMEMIAHGGKSNKPGKGPSVKVAKDFVAADMNLNAGMNSGSPKGMKKRGK